MGDISLKLKLLKRYIEFGEPTRCPVYDSTLDLLCRDCPLSTLDRNSAYRDYQFHNCTLSAPATGMDFEEHYNSLLRAELMNLIVEE